MKFEKKSPVVEAEWWDGTIEGARKIVDLVRDGTRYSFGYVVKTEFDGEETCSQIEFKRLASYTREPGPNVMQTGDWMVVYPNGHAEIVDPDIFQRDYMPAKEALSE